MKINLNSKPEAYRRLHEWYLIPGQWYLDQQGLLLVLILSDKGDRVLGFFVNTGEVNPHVQSAIYCSSLYRPVEVVLDVT